MKGLRMIVCSGPWYVLALVSFILMIGSEVILIRKLRDTRDWKSSLIAVVNMLFSFFLFFVLMDCGHSLINSAYPRTYLSFQFTLYELPWLLYAFLEFCCAGFLMICYRWEHRYRNRNLTRNAIREAVDLLPKGIAVCRPDGTVLLSNLRMDELCRDLTGGRLTDAGQFWEQVERTGRKSYNGVVLRVCQEQVWFLSRRQFEADGREYLQYSATEMTERYRITEELRERNKDLQDIQRRMRAVSELSGDMFVAQEQNAARADLHNQLGQVLLMGEHFLAHPESTDASMVYLTTSQMNRFLLGEAEKPEAGAEDELERTITMAGEIGVTADITGTVPRDSTVRSILAMAIQECAANTVKHAEGNRLTVDIKEDVKNVVIAIENNGKQPIKPIVESGGLLSLRKTVESAGGQMQIQSCPRLRVILRFPTT